MAQSWTWGTVAAKGLRGGWQEFVDLCNRRFRSLEIVLKAKQSWLGIVNVKDYGATGDGRTNDAPAIQRAIDTAVAGSYGTVWFPAGIYRCSSGLTVDGGILLQGAGSPSSSAGSVQAFAQLWHDFDGDFITFADQNTSGVIGGGGIDRLALVQNYGSSGGATCGKAVAIVAPSSGTPQVWMRFTHLQVENFSYTAPWAYCFYADGTANSTQLRDWFFADSRMAANAGATGGLYLSGVVNVFLHGVELNTSAGITVTGTSGRRSSNVNFVGCSCAATFALDYADTVLVQGGNYTSWSNTANTGSSGSPCVLLPGYSANTLTNNAGANCLFGVYNTTYGLRYQRPVTLDNGTFFSGMTTGGTLKRLAGISASDVLNIDPDGVGTRIGAATTVVGSVSPSADDTYDLGSGSFRWQDLALSGDARIKGVAYVWPSANASGVLTNNGSGTLTWAAGGGSGSSGMSALIAAGV